MTETLPTTERLASALEAVGDPRLAPIIASARQGLFDDFKSPLPFPLAALVGELRRLGLESFARRVMDGEFDSTQEEGEAWMNSPEGQATIAELLGVTKPKS